MSTDETEIEKTNAANQPANQTHSAKNQVEPYAQPTKFYGDAHISSKQIVAKMQNSSEDLLAELDEKVKSMMEKSQNIISVGKGQTRRASVCKVCGKEGQIVAISDHIEANHLEGIILPCNFCEKTFRTRVNKRHHIAKNHRN